MADLHDLTALEQAAAIRGGEVSPAELVAHYRDRIEAHGDALGAFVTVTADPANDSDRQARFSPYCAAYNLTGQPAVSLPWGTAADGAPIAVMLAAAPGADALLVAVSAWLEATRPWAQRHPAVWTVIGQR